MYRSKRKRNIIIFSLIGVLLCMVVGYAAFQTQLKVTGTSKVTSNWDIEITNVTSGTPTGSAENTVAPSYDKLWASMEADLYDKGDAMEYDVTIENKGTLDAKLNDIITNMQNSNSDAVIITFSGYTKGEILKSGNTKVVHVKIEYNPEYEGGETSSEVKINFDYTQNNNEENNPDNTYLVKYDCTTNGGEDCTSYNEYFSVGSNVDLNKIGSKEGFTFIGWNTNKDAKEKLDSLIMENSDTTLYAIFKDTTPPVCTLKVTSATIDTVTVEANCEDVSGISKYEYSINDNGYVDNKTDKSYTFDSFDLSTIKLKVTDGENNSAEFTLTEEELQNGYNLIYDFLNKEYEEILDKKETYEDEFLDKTYPVGSIYVSTSSANPSTTLGRTWKAYAQGRTLVGVDSNDVNFNAVNKEGGTNYNTLAVTNLPSHTHNIPALSGTAASGGTHTHSIPTLSGTTNSAGTHTHTYSFMWTTNTNLTRQAADGNGGWWFTINQSAQTSSSGTHTHSFTTKASTSGSSGTHTHTVTTNASTSEATGSGLSFTNLQPYNTVYIYKRIS